MITHKEERRIFERFLQKRQFKNSRKRDLIVDVFLSLHEHMTSEDIYQLVKQKDSSIGYTTVYRTLKLLCESGLCVELKFDDGVTRYEHLYNHPHHDHLICVECSTCIEFCRPEIEAMQNEIFEKYNFLPHHHKLELYGVCPKCRGSK
ncbi:hypothetical protein AB834_07010 [PVC group bacterium (ex Bugula neritina AB1)]|nr:hypothetical protein AB834_07010 [PVC group bacterium (ex Bugula neritina AB1)]